eukprot:gnl/Chilomastix_caulleri/249.p1 GENE.gnl/Chilomastix_caulleri/249~~gnl/Chilomastix_caulleri/249.p1  ORF type:complete len:281 (+),score=78.71 gnl/Chilomastix_caulleri/249:65-907(+)
MPNTSFALVPNDSEYKPIPTPTYGKCHHIGFEKGNKVDSFERGMNTDIRRLKKEELKRPTGFSLTVTFSGIQAFISLSLLLDYHKDLETVGHVIACPYSIPHDKFIKFIEGKTEDIIGNDVMSARLYHTLSRVSPKSLYHFISTTKEGHEDIRSNLVQDAINKRYQAYPTKDFISSPTMVMNRFSNLGDLNLSKGPFGSMAGYGISRFDIGSVNFSTSGQSDGSVLLLSFAHQSSYSCEFLKLYSDLLVRVLNVSAKHDVTYDELVSLPEYKAVLRCLIE